MKIYQSLSELLKEVPHVRLATELDNQKILEFYHQTEMKGSDQNIKYGRSNDFFLFLKERSEKNLVLTLWSDDSILCGVAVISYRTGYINGELTTVGYLGDLRVNLNRKLIREWRKMYSLFITHSKDLPETYFCRHYQTVIINDNQVAKSNLIKTQIPNLKYIEMANYQMINIIGRIKFPSFNEFYQKLTITHPHDSELPSLAQFCNHYHSSLPFGYEWGFEFTHRLKAWNNFDLTNILVIKDKTTQKILAATTLWNPIQSKQVIVSKVPWIFKLIVPILNFLPFIELKQLPQKNTPIDILYLNQISFADNLSDAERKIIVEKIISHIFSLNFSMLAYCDFKSQSFLKKNRTIISHQLPMTMYSVHPLDQIEVATAKLDPTMTTPGFEMSTV